MNGVNCFRCEVPGVMDGDEPRSFVTLYELEGLVYTQMLGYHQLRDAVIDKCITKFKKKNIKIITFRKLNRSGHAYEWAGDVCQIYTKPLNINQSWHGS